jgi:hypothetical protein
MEVKESGDFKRHLIEATRAGLEEVRTRLLTELKAVVGIANPTDYRAKVRNPAKAGQKTRKAYEHGAPIGGPPWTRTTTGQRSIDGLFVEGAFTLSLVIGVRPPGKYMIYLDQGVRYGHNGVEYAWPWANVTVLAMMPTLQQVFMIGAGVT